MPVEGLDGPCGVCGRVAGDHTLREWAACMGEVTTDLPYEAVPDDAVAAASRAVRERFGLGSDIVVADHVVVRSIVLTGDAGPVTGKFPGLLHEFQMGVPGAPPVEVAQVVFLGDVEAIRGYGRLVRDSANGAANAAERP